MIPIGAKKALPKKLQSDTIKSTMAGIHSKFLLVAFLSLVLGACAGAGGLPADMEGLSEAMDEIEADGLGEEFLDGGTNVSGTPERPPVSDTPTPGPGPGRMHHLPEYGHEMQLDNIGTGEPEPDEPSDASEPCYTTWRGKPIKIPCPNQVTPEQEPPAEETNGTFFAPKAAQQL